MTMPDLDNMEAPSTVEDVERLYFAIEEMEAESGMDAEWSARAAELKTGCLALLCDLMKGDVRH